MARPEVALYIADSVWRELEPELPDGVDRTVARTAVEVAIRAYINEAQHSLRKELEHKSPVLRRLRSLADRLARLSPGENEIALLDHLKALERSCTAEQIRAAFYLPSKRLERLRIRLTDAWTGPNPGNFSTSRGPLTRFLAAVITSCVPGAKLTNHGARAFLKRHERRRLLATWGVETKLNIDERENMFYLIGADGKRYSNTLDGKRT
jgi:hypothetical protein